MLVRLTTSLMMVALLSCVEASAQAQADFRKESFNYSEWTKGKFSEVVTVTNASKFSPFWDRG